LSEDGLELAAEGGFEEPDAVGILVNDEEASVSVSGVEESK
jgi:hypothetical protein